MKINEKFKDIEHVRILAKIEAQKTKECQRIYEAVWKGINIYLFSSIKAKKRGVEVVQYTPEVEDGDVFQDNGDGQSKPIKKAQSKEAKVKISESE